MLSPATKNMASANAIHNDKGGHMELIGYGFALLSIVCFGSTYVPTKQHPTYDGIIFQWFMFGASGTITGINLRKLGLIGGALWAVANTLIPSVVNLIGLGIGFVVWNSTNLLVAVFIARAGLFGLIPDNPKNTLLNLAGLCLMVLATVGFSLIKPRVPPALKTVAAEKRGTDSDGASLPLLAEEESPACQTRTTRAPTLAELPNFGPFELNGLAELYPEQKPASLRGKIIGFNLAIVCGVIFANSLTPFLLWMQHCQKQSYGILIDCQPKDFMFSQTLGAYLMSTAIFLIYSTFHRYKKMRMRRSALRPAYVSGIIWGIGLAAIDISIGIIGFQKAYPISAIGPAAISTLWSVLYFREIEGARNLSLMSAAMLFLVGGIALNIISY